MSLINTYVSAKTYIFRINAYFPVFFYYRTPHSYWPKPGLSYRSEGLPERDISSLGAMGWGLASAENSSAAAAVAVVAPWGTHLTFN